MNMIIGGALGRMGREMATAAAEAGNTVACGVDVAFAGQASDFPVVTEFSRITVPADVLIDFSRAEALPSLLAYAAAARMPLVLCATGYEAAERESISRAAETLPILQSVNMSLGVAVLKRLAVVAARALGDGYDVEIVEKHHRRKPDSPSGTALMLYEALNRAMGGETKPVYGRQGRAQARASAEIGLHSVRGGTVAGEHEIGFYGNGEELLLTHRAENRALFAQGALKAARFLLGKPAGLYAMEDVVQALLDGIE